MRIPAAIICIFLIWLLASCKEKKKPVSRENIVEMETFLPVDSLLYDTLEMTNYPDSEIFIDYTGSILNGFIIPSEVQTPSGYFEFSFDITNESRENTKYYYKIFYQNESYKFNEIEPDGSVNELSAENFYGSYEDVNTRFKSTRLLKSGQTITVRDRLRIVGNPRSEKKYFGNGRRFFHSVTGEQVEDAVELIRNNKEWFEMIKMKADSLGVDLEKQLKLDAEYFIKQKRIGGNENNRWKRNPRAGKYTFMVVMLPESSWQKLPDYIKSIDLKENNRFINPFYYFKYGEGRHLDHVAFAKTMHNLHIINKVPVTSGIWVPEKNNYGEPFDTGYFSGLINHSENIFNRAAFKLYENYRSRTDSIYNIPVVADFFGKGYSREEFERNAAISKNERIPIIIENTKAPGKNLTVDTVNNCLYLSNPGCSIDHPKKVNAGIITRHGFTYGKITAKVKFTELLDKDLIWNGITDAFWLIGESPESWNARRICAKEGYMPFYGAGEGEQRVPQISYTEIDFEILKAAETWPNYYPDGTKRDDPASNVDKIMVACTNWDMACPQPPNFGDGVHYIYHGDKIYIAQRWDKYYNAVTQKVPEKDDDLFKPDYYYYQLEWTPREIFWRIGPEKNQLRLIGYINETYTSIPNNQMLIIFTQEYHYSHWWPKAPFKQEDIPFPAKDMVGIIYEVTIE